MRLFFTIVFVVVGLLFFRSGMAAQLRARRSLPELKRDCEQKQEKCLALGSGERRLAADAALLTLQCQRVKGARRLVIGGAMISASLYLSVHHRKASHDQKT